MASRDETEINLEKESTPFGKLPASAEAAYDWLTGYGFARRYAKGKVVADICREDVGYGPRLLAETAESVTGVTDSPEAIDLASAGYSAPNVSYRRANLPELPLSEGYFDVVVAFGLVEELERPEDLVKEVKRVLKEEGVFVVSALDKQTNTNERNPGSIDGQREMYISEFRRMLDRHFEHVRMYRQGAVAGGFVFPATAQQPASAPMEVAQFSLTDPRLGVGSPATRSVIAVCGDVAGALEQEERPYLLLDRDRRVFDESEERAEDVELLRDEIQQLQETEVQAFIDAIKLRQSLIQELPRHLPHMRNLILKHLIFRRNIIRGNIYAIRKKGPAGLAKGVFRRSAALYRRLRARTRNPG